MPRPIGWARGPRKHNQRPHAHAQSGAGNSTRSANASATPNLPTRSAISHVGEPEKPRDRTNMSYTWTHAQGLANDSRRSTKKQNTSGHPKMTVQRQTHLVQAQNVPRQATEARGPRECIGHRHAHAQLPI